MELEKLIHAQDFLGIRKEFEIALEKSDHITKASVYMNISVIYSTLVKHSKDPLIAGKARLEARYFFKKAEDARKQYARGR